MKGQRITGEKDVAKWRMKREYLRRFWACAAFLMDHRMLSGGMGHEGHAYALVGGATIAWIDTRALSLEVTSILC